MCSVINVMHVTVPIFREMCFRQARICAENCDEMHVDGIYTLCEDCRKYIQCNGSSQINHACPEEPNRGLNVDTGQCQYKSPHCFPCNGRLHVLRVQCVIIKSLSKYSALRKGLVNPLSRIALVKSM